MVENMILPLSRIKKVDGSTLLPDTLNTDERKIADMFNYNASTKKVTITLPTGYASDTVRWDDTNKIFSLTAGDINALSYKAEEIQSQQS